MSDEGPLSGVTVVELANYFMGPGCGAILAAHGAEVIKVEPAGSADPARTNRSAAAGNVVGPGFELVNNAKRSIQLDLKSDAGLEVLERLFQRADVFLTNMRARPLERLGIDAESVTQRHPRLIYAHGTGYGPVGPVADSAAFDELAYWARGGIGAALRTDDGPPVQLVGAMGDLPTSVALSAGILMALLRREHTGCGGIVDASLFGAGLWANGLALSGALNGAPPRRPVSRMYRGNPLYTIYRCGDNRWVQFAMGQTDRFWAPVCEALARPELITDERFATHELRLANNVAAIAELQDTIATLTRDELGRRMDERDLFWAPILELNEVADDEQARVNEYVVEKHNAAGEHVRTIAPPFRLRDAPLRMEPAPVLGQHLEEVLLELGYDWDDIARLRERGAF